MTRLTARGRVVVGSLTGLVAAGAIAQGIHANSSHEDSRISGNERIITQTTHLLDGVVYLGNGVHVRNSMLVDNGDSNRADPKPSNTRYTVGKGHYNGKLIVVTRPIVETDKKGKEWIAFDDPDTSPESLHDKAKGLGYVAVEQIAADNPGLVRINSYKNSTESASITAVDYVSTSDGLGAFEKIGTDQQMSYAMTATTIAADGK